MKNSFAIRSFIYWCSTCKSEVKVDPIDEELCWLCKQPVTMVLDGEVNPHPKQILTYDKLGNVDGGYFNPKWEEWERENKK
ncbi:MAG: hypothetical protein ACHQF4_02455 [Sphingobacteriales bacterium]|jgi:hypothetical protein